MEELRNLNEGYFLLAIAIVKQAADDYRMSYRRFLRSGIRNSTMVEIERWMTRGLGSILSLNRGKVILRQIQREEEQRRRQTKIPRPTQSITLNGKTQTLREWANEIGIKMSTLKKRLYSGWTIEASLTTPIDQSKVRTNAKRNSKDI